MFSRAPEISGAEDPHDLAEACEVWEEFRQHALREGLEEIAAGRKRIQELFESRSEVWPEDASDVLDIEPTEWGAQQALSLLAGKGEAKDLVERSRNVLPKMHAEDREEAIDLHERIGLPI
jgi:hypothetical protein